jgi:MFS family permease
VSFAAGGLLAASGWAPLFLADAFTTLLFALLVWRRVPETRPATAAVRGGGTGFGEVLGDGVFLAFLGLHLLLLLVFLQFMVAAPLDMAERGLSTATYGRVLAANGLLIVLLQPLLTRWAGRLDPSRALALAAALVGLGFGGYGLARGAWQLAGATAVWTLGEILMAPVGAAVVAALAPPALRGRYQGLFGLSWGLGMLLSPPLGAAVLTRAGPGPLWAGCLAVALLVAAGHLAAGGARRRRMAERAGP